MKDENRRDHESEISVTADTGPKQAVPASGISIDSCCGTSKELQRTKALKAGASEEPGTHEQISFPIGGMSCQSCVGRIEEALSGCPGVIKAVVDFQRREAGVRFDPVKANPDVLKTAVEKVGCRVLENRAESIEEEVDGSGFFSRLRPYLIGTAAALAVVGFYLGLLTLTSDWHNARSEFGKYSLWILALATGLGLQATLFLLFRAWHSDGGTMKGAKCSLATSGGMTTTAMAACCSHYLALVLPVLGLPFLSTAAAGLADYQIYFFLAGVLSNLFGIGFMLRLMIRSGMIRIKVLESPMIFGAEHIKQ
jgi:copper chaperone CopZ